MYNVLSRTEYNRKYNRVVYETTTKYYSENSQCALTLMHICCKAMEAGAQIIKEFVTNPAVHTDSEVKAMKQEAFDRIFSDEIISELPDVHRVRRVNVLKDFMRDAIAAGVKFYSEVLSEFIGNSKTAV